MNDREALRIIVKSYCEGHGLSNDQFCKNAQISNKTFHPTFCRRTNSVMLYTFEQIAMAMKVKRSELM